MKILVTGGMKSGKSRFAEARTLELAGSTKPIYLATTERATPEMQQRIAAHQQRRQGRFVTREEPLALQETVLQFPSTALIECMTMWLNNMLHHQKPLPAIFNEAERLMQLSNPLVLVINEVGLGIIPNNALARQFVDISGKISQMLGHHADEVYFCAAGQTLRMK